MLKISPIHAFHDNYIWCIYNPQNLKAVVVDPGDAQAVIDYLEANQLTLEAILITHHHPDHIGGLSKLSAQYSPTVYGFRDANFKGVTRAFADGEDFELLGRYWQIITVPGHTLDHIAFYSPAQASDETPWLFCGDTLFSGGCGRLFEGTPAQMRASLSRISKLPSETLVFPAHEYTLANLEFALHVEPDNKDTQAYQAACQKKRSGNQATLPSTLLTESKINPFLRWDQPGVHDFARKQAAQDTTLSEDEVFALVRQAKDHF